MCRLPVTLGGGMTIEYGGREGSGSAWKSRLSSHSRVQRDSTAAGSKRVVSFR